jgi:hypothetical protein
MYSLLLFARSAAIRAVRPRACSFDKVIMNLILRFRLRLVVIRVGFVGYVAELSAT